MRTNIIIGHDNQIKIVQKTFNFFHIRLDEVRDIIKNLVKGISDSQQRKDCEIYFQEKSDRLVVKTRNELKIKVGREDRKKQKQELKEKILIEICKFKIPKDLDKLAKLTNDERESLQDELIKYQRRERIRAGILWTVALFSAIALTSLLQFVLNIDIVGDISELPGYAVTSASIPVLILMGAMFLFYIIPMIVCGALKTDYSYIGFAAENWPFLGVVIFEFSGVFLQEYGVKEGVSEMTAIGVGQMLAIVGIIYSCVPILTILWELIKNIFWMLLSDELTKDKDKIKEAWERYESYMCDPERAKRRGNRYYRPGMYKELILSDIQGLLLFCGWGIIEWGIYLVFAISNQFWIMVAIGVVLALFGLIVAPRFLDKESEPKNGYDYALIIINVASLVIIGYAVCILYEVNMPGVLRSALSIFNY